MATPAVVAISNPADVNVASSMDTDQSLVLKCTALLAGRVMFRTLNNHTHTATALGPRVELTTSLSQRHLM